MVTTTFSHAHITRFLVHPKSSRYTRKAFLDLAKETVFQKRWLFVGHEAQLQEPGDYFTGSFLGWPYLVVRDDRGSLQAFYNVCSHHGTCVATESGNAEQFVCPYHGWTYDRQGALTSAPLAGALQSLKQRNLDRKPIPVEQWGPLAALHFGDQTSSLAQELAPLQEALPGILSRVYNSFAASVTRWTATGKSSSTTISMVGTMWLTCIPG